MASQSSDPEEPPPRTTWATRLGIDPAVAFALGTRGWQFLAGPVTALMIAGFFSGAQQGYFYTFWSLIELQIFFELGFSASIIHVASHEWAKLRINGSGAIEGNADNLSRLISLGRLIFSWYAVAGAAFMLLVGVGGAMFLSQNEAPGFDWVAPWICLVVVNGLLIWVFPFSAFLEGCNQVAAIHRLAMIQAVTGNLAVWTFIALGGGLWTAVVAAGVRLAWYLVLVLVQYGRFFRPFFRRPAGPKMHWREEVWPMQWRAGVQSVFGYFSTWLFTPVIFSYHDPAAAGRMGMTWTIVIALQRGALAWVQTRAARFGILAAQGETKKLDQQFFRLTTLAAGVFVLGSAAFVGGIVVLNTLEWKLATRLLPPLTAAMLLGGALMMLITLCQNIHVRSHKQDPFLLASVISSTAIGLAVWLLGASSWAADGIAIGYLTTTTAVALPLSTLAWWRFTARR